MPACHVRHMDCPEHFHCPAFSLLVRHVLVHLLWAALHVYVMYLCISCGLLCTCTPVMVPAKPLSDPSTGGRALTVSCNATLSACVYPLANLQCAVVRIMCAADVYMYVCVCTQDESLKKVEDIKSVQAKLQDPMQVSAMTPQVHTHINVQRHTHTHTRKHAYTHRYTGARLRRL